MPEPSEPPPASCLELVHSLLVYSAVSLNPDYNFFSLGSACTGSVVSGLS